MRMLGKNDFGYTDETMAVHDPINEYDPMYRMTIAEDWRCNLCASVLEVVGTVCILAALVLVVHWSLRP